MASKTTTPSVGDPPSLNTLPCELVEQIYILSENLQLLFVNRFFYQYLNHPIIRLKFSSHAFNRPFSSEYQYTSYDFTADNERDRELVKLQTSMIEQKWFDTVFARKLEDMTPELKARKSFSLSDPSFSWSPGPNGPKKVRIWRSSTESHPGPINVHMPRKWLFGPWTKDNIEMLDRFRIWYIHPVPITNGDPDKSLFWSAMSQACKTRELRVIQTLLRYSIFDDGFDCYHDDHVRSIKMWGWSELDLLERVLEKNPNLLKDRGQVLSN